MCSGLPSKDESLLPVDVKRRDDLREGHVSSDGAGHAHLVDLQVGVGRDDGSGREVHALPHQVSSHSAFFPLQPLFDGFERTAGFLHRLKWKFEIFSMLILWSLQQKCSPKPFPSRFIREIRIWQ